MSFPFTFEETFDDGTKGNFNTETDTSSILDFPHYSELARFGLAPWRGAYCMRARLVDDAVGFVVETDGFDVASDGTLYIHFTVLFAENLTLADTNTVVLFAMQSAGPVSEAVFGIRNNSGAYEVFFGETGATRTKVITRSNHVWHEVEMFVNLDNAGNNDGTLDVWFDGALLGAQIASLDQGAITQASYGVVSGTAATNSGTILFGPIIADDTRVYTRERFPQDRYWITRDMHAFIGPGTIDAALLTATADDATLFIYDTDRYSATGTDFSRTPAMFIRNASADDMAPGQNLPVKINHGAYCVLSGTNPQAFLTVSCGATVKSRGNYVDRGLKRA